MERYFDPRISRVIQLELEITEAIFKGHRPDGADQFKSHREELKQLRKELNIKRELGYEQSGQAIQRAS